MLVLSHQSKKLIGKITLTASKSESNRALIIQALCDDMFEIKNLAEADDTRILQGLLQSDNIELSSGIAGTVMRFMTAYLSIQNKDFVLTGDKRMKERPIKILVDALNDLGAQISYAEQVGYPPLIINNANLNGDKVLLDGSVSSQYVSALLLIAPKLKHGLQIKFEGEIISKPYINMTINMMQYFGVHVKWNNDSIIVSPGKYKAKDFIVEADWSAASYWYSMVAIAKDETEIILYGLKKDSLQGDSEVVNIYKKFGVITEFIDGGVRLTKSKDLELKYADLLIDFIDCPDLAQTVAVTCAALNVKAKLVGLKTLRIKETDRITALQDELNKLGFNIEVNSDDLIVNPINNIEIINTHIKTYNDHRMAMAFAPLAMIKSIKIEDPEVVKKSYPNFWQDLKLVGFKI
ncbi:MAG: 3-phosphoshikimate 1-carboxyvinyltransferase [Vicingaceae bacterium]|nr:3-phosphoshikimate 1-carboxyvinyltransferase [Vicingaceae bacterium]